jgi:hypothetical protein
MREMMVWKREEMERDRGEERREKDEWNEKEERKLTKDKGMKRWNRESEKTYI